MILPKVDSGRIGDLSKLVKDVIDNEQVPSFLWAIISWPKADEFSFVKNISIPVQIDKSNTPINLPICENINKQWFFVDMNSDAKLKFLLKTEDKYFAHPFRWIIADATHETIQNLTILPNSNIILVNKDVNSKRYILKQGKLNHFFFRKICKFFFDKMN